VVRSLSFDKTEKIKKIPGEFSLSETTIDDFGNNSSSSSSSIAVSIENHLSVSLSDNFLPQGRIVQTITVDKKYFHHRYYYYYYYY
jgi:hypothetical protein